MAMGSKILTARLFKDRIQDFAHDSRSLPLQVQHIYVAYTTSADQHRTEQAIYERIIAKSLIGIQWADFSALVMIHLWLTATNKKLQVVPTVGVVQICRFNRIHERQFRSTKALLDTRDEGTKFRLIPTAQLE